MGKFRLRKRKQRSRIQREIPIRTMIPNLMTLLAAASGVTSIRYSCQEHWRSAVIAIIIACMLDGLDGRVARLLRVTSKLGAQLDSLADFVSFGVAPALLVYFWMMQVAPPGTNAYAFRGLFWALALFHAMCCAFRLARFNIMLDDGPTQPYWKHFFMGLPAPGGAGILLTPVIWQLHTESAAIQSPWIGCAMLMVCGILMACRAPTISAKHLRVPAKRMVPVLLFVMFVIGMLVSQFWLTLGVIGILYFASIPFCGFWYLKLRRRYQAQQPQPPNAASTHPAAAPSPHPTR
ncbi:MAG: phosphatidylcholine/phosphatidylserine synthase [Kiritimatiellia bacterium]|jgi:CDP-diacylglycerol--serine O-phosphatidyltransferase|nr:phosphatidylcholine/phosphatidylserine synthase [Kiritimatiellia bacterium]MDD4442922.1 phosphatidylcholine/phosphatidylserine synthase [Kiritimatiellia bacterium]NLC82397.1 phosphatidylcholine/phosphatidylserine synthase [Lentisphaerota bacterium]